MFISCNKLQKQIYKGILKDKRSYREIYNLIKEDLNNLKNRLGI
jgi:hypothetical protein